MRLSRSTASDSELLRLPYFDTVNFVVVDPTHNVLLETTRNLTALWKDNGLWSTANFDYIQSTVDKFITPADIWRVP